MDFKQQVVDALHQAIGDQLTPAEISNLVETPKTNAMGDYAFPTLSLIHI